MCEGKARGPYGEEYDGPDDVVLSLSSRGNVRQS
jgi:hypothetical protein